MNKLLIAALLVSNFAHAAPESTETVFHKFLIYGSLSEGNKDITLVITRNPAMALMVAGSDSPTMDRISRGRLMCRQVSSDNRRAIQAAVVGQNATAAQMEQAIALGLEVPEAVSKSYNMLRAALKFVNDAGDAPYYRCN